MLLKTLFILTICLSTSVFSILIESSQDEENSCNFDDRRLAESVRFIRSKYSCRVYHVCAFYKQYTLTCAEGLYFDEDSDSCNYQEIVYCPLPEDEITDQENSSVIYVTNQYSKQNVSEINEIIESTTLFVENSDETLVNTELITEEITTNLPEITTEILTTTILPTSSRIPVTLADFNTYWLGPNDCIQGFEHKISHQENCGLFYQCTKDGQKLEKACPYPLQYDEMLNECRFYDLIDCGLRKQAKSLCDYQLSSTVPNTIPCEKYPSCKNLSDGLYPSNDCRHYFQCKDERTLRIYSCPKDKQTGVQLKFNFLTKRCDILENVSFNCGGYAIPIDIYTNKMVCPAQHLSKNGEQPSMETRDLYFSHPSECHLYITCDQQGNMSILECYNGTHFSPYYQSCVHPSVANCKKYNTMDETSANLSLKNLLFDSRVKSGLLKEKEELSSTTEIMTTIELLTTTVEMNLTNSSNSSVF
ncbi:unnamed protein product [Brachionus calyciflorus]|uniref:Chitin-binding type-2 domain-containing protein n=1 Tax=Brachionus calyciflorus TaxID=104777 RepID=A0A813UN97_9BILA|nr:unnamed protein product [Brachionus calyciflorus]